MEREVEVSDSQMARSIDNRCRYQFDSDNSVSVIRSQLVLAKDNDANWYYLHC